MSNFTYTLLKWLKYIVPILRIDILEAETNPQIKRTWAKPQVLEVCPDFVNLLIKQHGCWKSSRTYGLQKSRDYGRKEVRLLSSARRSTKVLLSLLNSLLIRWASGVQPPILRGRMLRHSTDLQMSKLKPTVPVVHKILVLLPFHFAFPASIKNPKWKYWAPGKLIHQPGQLHNHIRVDDRLAD